MPLSESCIDTLRLSQGRRARLLKRLAREADAGKYLEMRSDRRVAFDDTAGLVMKVFHPGGSNGNYVVRPRNISRSGIAFFHGHYLYPGSSCDMLLKTVAGPHQLVHGKVVWCRHLDDHFHEVGVQFETPIVLNAFIDSLVRATGEDGASHELPQFAGRLLYVEDSVDDRALLSFHMSQVGVQIETVADGIEALGRVQADAPDLILANVCLPGMHGLELTQMLRAEGFDRPIVLLTANPRHPDDDAARAVGASAVLRKPYTFEQLVTTVREHLPETSADEAVAPVLSAHWGNRRMRPLILNFLSRLDGQLAQLRQFAVGRDNDAMLEKMCLDLRGSAGNYGFPQISEAAERLYELCRDDADADDVQRAMTHLEALCNSANDTAATAPVDGEPNG